MLHKNIKGFGLIEILIVGAVIGIGFVGIAAFLINSSGLTFQVIRNTEAVSLAEEGMEAVRSMRDESWSANIATRTSGTTYYPKISAVDSKWILTTDSADGQINDLYTRTVTFESVNRDATSDDIAPSGTLDEDTKEVVVKVTWNENQATKDVTLTTYITNFIGN